MDYENTFEILQEHNYVVEYPTDASVVEGVIRIAQSVETTYSRHLSFSV